VTQQPPPPAQPPASRRSKVLILGVAGLGLALLLVAVALKAGFVGRDTPTTTTRQAPKLLSINGTLTLHQDPEAGAQEGDLCSGTGGYDDIDLGTSVVVTNEQGTVVGTGSLGPGSTTSSLDCDFTFTVADLPEARFYGIEVSHRGRVTFSRQQLDQDGWDVGLTLGS
jgi:D-arabinose 1-dehydrogenase-like Zn-dependent alcohol dehydrogenase